MNTAYVVLAVLAVIYVPIWIWVWRKPEQAGRYHLVKYGPAIMIKTRLGMVVMDRLARFKRFWRGFGFVSKLISAILLVLMVYMMVIAVMALPERFGSSAIGIQYALAIPGFNPILPLSYGVIALCVALVIHEMGHGIQTRANGCKVDSTGLLYLVVPVGAFVEPNEEEMSKQSRRVQMDMYTAGISVNTFMAVICMVLMVASCSVVSSPYDDEIGVYSVADESPIYYSGIPASALITGIYDSNGDPVEYGYIPSGTSVVMTFPGDLTSPRPVDPTQTYTIEYEYERESMKAENVQLGAFIRTITKNSPASSAGISPGELLYTLTSGSTTYYIASWTDFTTVMSYTSPGDVVTVTTVTVTDGGAPEVMTYEDIVLSSKGSIGFLGMSVNDSGMTMVTPQTLLDRAVDPFYGCDTPISYVQGLFSYMSGPFNGMDPISKEVQWWYDAPGGSFFWMIVTLLYWIFWIDLLLAITNALPAIPFDGGFIFAGGVNWFLEKIGIKDEERRQKMSDGISKSVSTIALFMFILVFMAFII